MPQYDLVAAIRIYPGISKEPVYFADNKEHMVRRMLETFVAGAGTLKVKYHIILDKCPDSYVPLVNGILSGKDITFHIVKEGGGNMATFLQQIDILLEQNDSDIVMFAEDDYLYRDGMLEPCVQFAREKKVDFVAPFDHFDYYSMCIHDHPVKIRLGHGLHWRETNSTTLTFITKKEVLRTTQRYFRTFGKKNWDSSIFWTLCKYHVFSLKSFFRFVGQALKGDPYLLKMWLRCWYFTPLANFTTRRHYLWSPIPSAATHLQEGGIAPNIDWDPIADSN